MRPPVEVEVAIHALAAGGDAVGKDDGGRTTFVAGAAPGERVRVALIEEHARWARGALRAIVAPSPARVEPPCPYFAARACGGCDWQHVDGDTQRAAKQAIVAGALRRLIAGGLTLAPLIAPEPALGWRRRARWTARAGALGYHGPRTHAVCDVARCPQLAPALDAALAAIRAALPALALGDGEVHAVAGAAGALHVVIDARCDPAAAAALVGVAGIAGVAWPGGAAGAATVELEPGLAVRADEFAQAGALGNAALRAEVAAALALAPGQRVLELHAGAGNFTRELVAAGADVVASDHHAPARRAAPLARFVAGDAAAVVADLVAAGERFDAVLLDPPRTGALAVMAKLAATGADRVVYVSCDPATFARDAAVLAADFRPVGAVALDLMPQTAHVELVARFSRA